MATNREAIIKMMAHKILEKDPQDKNFRTLFDHEFHQSDFLNEERSMVKIAVGHVLAGLRRRQAIQLTGARTEALRANEKIAPLH